MPVGLLGLVTRGGVLAGGSSFPRNAGDGRLPEAIGPWRVVDVLGSGGMARVYRCRHVHSERVAAVKLLYADYLIDPRMIDRFVRECRILAQLDHPNCVAIIEAGEVDGVPYLAMPIVRGATWDEVFLGPPARAGAPDAGSRRPPSASYAADAVKVALRMCHVLAACHAAGIIHRDVKPANILVGERMERALLMDFGVAAVRRFDVKATSSSGTQTGHIVGSAFHISPEEVEGSRLATFRSDVYALGVSLYYILTGRYPVEVDPEVPSSLRFQRALEATREAPARPVWDLFDGFPAALGEALMSCLEKDPRRRPSPVAAAARLGRACGLEAQVVRLFGRKSASYLERPVPLVGMDGSRRDVMRVAGELIERTLVFDPATVVLAGPSGAGASRLVEVMCRSARRMDIRVCATSCRADRQGDWVAGIIRRSLRHVQHMPARAADCRKVAGQIWEALGLVGTTDEIEGAAGLIVQLIRVAYQAGGFGRPCLLVVEDVHNCDAWSLRLLVRLVERLGGDSSWILTVQPSSPLRHPGLLPLLDRLVRVQGAQRIDLPPLSPGEVEELVGLMLGGDPYPEDVTDGVAPWPGLVQELLQRQIDEGRLWRTARAQWRYDDDETGA